jgi:hypothetical protein
MKRRTRVTIIIIGSILGIIMIGFVGRVVYMIACISCTYPPIKTYEFQGNIDDLRADFYEFANNPGISCRFTNRGNTDPADSVGTDLTIELKRDTSTIKYGFVCEVDDDTVDIALVSATNWDGTYGGYTKNAAGVNEFVKVFEKNFLQRLEKENNVIITAK